MRTRGPRGRFSTELHFYDVPVNQANGQAASTPARPGEKHISAGGTDDGLTGRRSTGAPVTGTPATGAPVDRTSSRRLKTKTTSTDSAEAAVLDAAAVIRKHTDADDGKISELLTQYAKTAKKLPAYVTGLPQKDHLARDLQELRDRREHADTGQIIAQLRTGPPCGHGVPGGAALHPRTGMPLCPQCRNERKSSS